MNKKLVYVVMLLALVVGLVAVPAAVARADGRVSPVLPGGDETIAAGASIAAAPAGPSAVALIYVRAGGDDTLCDGTANLDYTALVAPNCAFKTIQKGVNSVASGGTVKVAAGTYLESDIAITQPLTLTGAGEGSTLVGPAVADSQVCTSGLAPGNHHGILIQSSDVTVQDLTVDGNLGTLGALNYHVGITTDYVTATYNNITVKNVTVKNVWFRGVVVRAKAGGIGTGALIDHVTVQNVGGCNTSAVDRQNVWGITLHAASGEIRNSSVSGSGHGIATGNTTGTQTDVDVHDNTVSSIDCQQYTLVHNGAGSSFFNNVGSAGGTWANECATGLVTYYSELSVRASTFTGAPWGVYVGYQNMAVDKLVLGPNLKVIGPVAAVAGSIGVQSDGNSLFWQSTNRFTMDGATVQGFETGIQVGNQVSGNTTVADVKNSVITSNGTGVLVNDGATLTVHNSDLSGNTPTGVTNARTDSVFVDATANWWGSASCPVSPYIVGNVAVGTCAAALVTGPTASTHEIGETGTLDTKVTAIGLFGVQFVVNHTPGVLTSDGGTTFNAGTAPNDWDWSQTFLAKNFAKTSGQTALAATLQSPLPPGLPKLPANLVNGLLATWKYKCTGVGTSPLVYDTSVGTGSYLSDKNGFPIPAVWLGDSITCVAATGSVEGIIQLQGRGTNPHAASWYGAEVKLTCASLGCAGYGPYTMTTDDLGHYQLLKSGPGTGIAAGDYTATVTRRAYLGATTALNVVPLNVVTVVAGATTTVTPAPTLLGGDVNDIPGVEIGDLSAIGGLFGTPITADTGPDVNGDGWVNIFDLVLAGGNFGLSTLQTW